MTELNYDENLKVNVAPEFTGWVIQRQDDGKTMAVSDAEPECGLIEWEDVNGTVMVFDSASSAAEIVDAFSLLDAIIQSVDVWPEEN